MGAVSVVFSYLVFFNVILSYGMETSFFRFYNKEKNQQKVIATATISLLISSLLVLVMGLLFYQSLADWTHIDAHVIKYSIGIIVLDALVIIPFSKLRAEKKPVKYAIVKTTNVLIYLLLNIFFLVLLPQIVANNPDHFLEQIYIQNFEVGYIFIGNLMASLVTFLLLLPQYFQIQWQLDIVLWKKMMRYGLPILLAGMGFAINEHFDKILLDWMHINMSEIGAYAACYKIGLFMVLFRTAYTLGIEPFFFSHAEQKEAPKTYAIITKYFVILGSFIFLCVVVTADFLKIILVPNPDYWSAMKVVPLIVLANFFLGIYTNLSVWYKLIDKTMVGAYISALGAVITLVFNVLLIPYFGYMGAAVATLLAYGTMMFVSYFLGRKKYPIPYEIGTMLQYFLLALFLAVLAFYVPVFQYNWYFSILFVSLYMGFVYYKEQHTIKQFFNKP